MNKWIPVTEKLPERDGLYIVTFDGGLVGQKEPFASTNYFENGQWDDGDSVIAWMRPVSYTHLTLPTTPYV